LISEAKVKSQKCQFKWALHSRVTCDSRSNLEGLFGRARYIIESAISILVAIMASIKLLIGAVQLLLDSFVTKLRSGYPLKAMIGCDI
jgi:hypothetical protein